MVDIGSRVFDWVRVGGTVCTSCSLFAGLLFVVKQFQDAPSVYLLWPSAPCHWSLGGSTGREKKRGEGKGLRRGQLWGTQGTQEAIEFDQTEQREKKNWGPCFKKDRKGGHNGKQSGARGSTSVLWRALIVWWGNRVNVVYCWSLASQN